MKQLVRYSQAATLALLLAAPAASSRAQAPVWAQLATGTHTTRLGTDTSTITAVVADAAGNVLVTGFFKGTITFGSIVLTGAGTDADLFVAKYLPATGTWAWAQRGGGNFYDYGAGLVLSGNNVYVVGTVNSGPSPGFTGITFGGTSPASSLVPLPGNYYFDIVVAKYTDQGTSATLNWVQALGNTADDSGTGIAVNGPSVYVAGVNGHDWYLTKLTDTGTSATQGWAYTGGGTTYDLCTAMVANGPNIYLTGYITNSATNANGVFFTDDSSPYGVAVTGTSSTTSTDLAVLKYVDNGATATLKWAQVAGGSQADSGQGLAVSGSSVYVTGSITNDTANSYGVVLAGTVPQPGATFMGSEDWLLAKYTDNGTSASLSWAQVAGGTNTDKARAVAVSGNTVYVTGTTLNDTYNTQGVVFGGTGTSTGTLPQPGVGSSSWISPDFVVAKYTDNGSSATVQWAQAGGGAYSDTGTSIAVSGQNIYAGGGVVPPASFGAFPIAGPASTTVNALARLVDRALTPLATTAGAPARAGLYPNPAREVATLSGAAPGQAVQLLDVLGRPVLAATTDATGTAQLALPPGLAPGMYVVRAGSQTLRLAVE